MKKLLKKLVKIIFAMILAAGALFFYSRYIEPNLLVTTAITQEAEGYEGVPFRVVLFSDTHFGSYYDEKNIEKIVDAINKKAPDMVVFGGDFFDNYAKESALFDMEYLSEQLSKIKAPRGKYAIFGNHDHGGGAIRVYEQLMEGGGFEVLKNETVLFEEENIKLTGLDDYRLGSDHGDLLKVDNDYFNIVASHQPDVIDEMKIRAETLMLAGHSHGGQVSLPFITSKMLPSGAENYIKGRYKVSDFAEVFVTKGIGTTRVPMRFLNVPEIAVIDIK